jgi:hypothetical protein
MPIFKICSLWFAKRFLNLDLTTLEKLPSQLVAQKTNLNLESGLMSRPCATLAEKKSVKVGIADLQGPTFTTPQKLKKRIPMLFI